MLRFLPDSWLDGLLRPLLLADPSAGLYYEVGAPDWRFIALIGALLLALVAGRLRHAATAEQGRALLILAALFYTWTFTIGNGRYFIAGLMMVGPLVVMAWQWLPGTRAFRSVLLIGLVIVQGWTVGSMYVSNAWSLAGWTRGPAIYLSPSPVREHPAVFVTLTGISFSALVPLFHPESRWTNLSGQVDMTPDRPEYPRAQQLLRSGLPMYTLLPAIERKGAADSQPDDYMWSEIARGLGHRGLELAGKRCEVLRTNILPLGQNAPGKVVPHGAFWVCPIALQTAVPADGKGAPDAMEDVFATLESYCPRFFPPGGAATRRYDGYWLRNYLGSDTRVTIDDGGMVSYKYFRHFTPVAVGTADDVRKGRLDFDCKSLPGRYRPPWVSP